MQSNGIEIPDPSTSRQVITDPIGGWMFIITTVVSREMKKLADASQEVDNIKQNIADEQALLAELEPHVAVLEAAAQDQMTP